MAFIEKPTRSASLSPSLSKEKRTWQQSANHHLEYVVGYNWTVAASIAPIAFAVAFLLAVVLPEAAQQPWRPPPIAVLCVAGYIFFEVTAFCLERNWSRVSIWHFWRIAGPLAALQAFLCLRLAPHDVLTCLLFVSLCLGCREFLFQFQALCQSTRMPSFNNESMQQRLMMAFWGGSTYGFTVALLCGLTGILTHAVIGDGRLIHSAVMLEVLCVLALPFGRNVLRMGLNRTLIAAIPVSFDSQEELPKLDALVAYSDVLFWLTMFLEVAFAFVFILVPNTLTFCMALIVNLVIDALFPRALDDIQRRGHATDLSSQPETNRSQSLTSEASQSRPTASTSFEQATSFEQDTSFCLERPESIFLVLSNGVSLSDSPSETSPLQPVAESSAGTDYSNYPEFFLPVLLWWKQTCSRLGGDIELQVDNPMSPRITRLLDDKSHLVVGCRAGHKEIYAFLQQERMIALNTHFLGSTLGLFLVVVAIPVAKFAGDNNHTEFLGLQHFTVAELALRAVSALAFRVLADIVALSILEKSTNGSDGFIAMPAVFWECRHELSTWNACAFRVLAATCPLFAIIAATL